MLSRVCQAPVPTFLPTSPESFDPAKSSLFPSSMDHSSRITNCASPTFNFFLFCRFRTLAAQWVPATPLSSIASGLFLSPWGYIPPRSPQRLLLPCCAPTETLLSPFFFVPLRTFSFTTRGYTPPSIFISHPCTQTALCERTNCALFRNNSFPCHTCVFHGGEGGMNASIQESRPKMKPESTSPAGLRRSALQKQDAGQSEVIFSGAVY